MGAGRGGGPSPEFRARLRANLIAAYPEESGNARESGDGGEDHPSADGVRARPAKDGERARAVGPRPPHRAMIARGVFLAVAMTLVTTVLVAYRAVPGDVLYPLKRGAESTMLGLSTDDLDRAERKLRAAQERAAEVAMLLGSADRIDLVTQTLDDMERSTRSAVCTIKRVEREDLGAGAGTSLRRFAEKQHDTVAPMLPRMDEDTQRQAHGYLSYIDSLATPG